MDLGLIASRMETSIAEPGAMMKSRGKELTAMWMETGMKEIT